MTNNTKLRVVQYKILHDAYPTMKHLYTWRIKDNPNCTYCNTPETTEHAIWTCPVAQSGVRTLKNILNINEISKVDFIAGTVNNHALNTIFTLVKRKLILQRENKQFLTRSEIIEIVSQEMLIEKYVAKKNNKESKFTRRWRNYIGLINTLET
jgi:hypothetical protein